MTKFTILQNYSVLKIQTIAFNFLKISEHNSVCSYEIGAKKTRKRKFNEIKKRITTFHFTLIAPFLLYFFLKIAEQFKTNYVDLGCVTCRFTRQRFTRMGRYNFPVDIDWFIYLFILLGEKRHCWG